MVRTGKKKPSCRNGLEEKGAMVLGSVEEFEGGI